MSYVLILGAKSDVAKAIAKIYFKNGYNLYLASRNSSQLKNFASELSRNSKRKIKLFDLDILEYEKHKKIYDDFDEKPVGVICAIGYLGDQKKGETEFNYSSKIINTNYSGIVSFLNVVVNDFENRGHGFIVGISSVAGDRGRKKNYLYGSAKAAFTSYLSGIRNRLYKKNVHVLTVKPGYIKTKMTNHLKLPKALTITTTKLASEVYNAQQNKKEIIYTKSIWFWLMILIKLLPESFFKKTEF